MCIRDRIEDASARTGKHVDGNDMLEIIMARDGKVICLWHDCQWERNSGITTVSYTHRDVYKRQQVDEERILRPAGEALLRNSAK